MSVSRVPNMSLDTCEQLITNNALDQANARKQNLDRGQLVRHLDRRPLASRAKVGPLQPGQSYTHTAQVVHRNADWKEKNYKFDQWQHTVQVDRLAPDRLAMLEKMDWHLNKSHAQRHMFISREGSGLRLDFHDWDVTIKGVRIGAGIAKKQMHQSLVASDAGIANTLKELQGAAFGAARAA